MRYEGTKRSIFINENNWRLKRIIKFNTIQLSSYFSWIKLLHFIPSCVFLQICISSIWIRVGFLKEVFAWKFSLFYSSVLSFKNPIPLIYKTQKYQLLVIQIEPISVITTLHLILSNKENKAKFLFNNIIIFPTRISKK